MYFRHRYPPVHIVQKLTYNTQKIVAEKSDFMNFLVNFFLGLEKGWYFHIARWKWNICTSILILAIYGRLKIWLK